MERSGPVPGPGGDERSASARKRVLVVLGGALGPGLSEGPGAETPVLDGLCRRGRAGVATTAADTPAPSPWGAFCALLGLPQASAPSLAAAEAAGIGEAVPAGHSVWRADFVTVADRGVLDPFGGKIRDPEATALLDAAARALPDLRFRRLDGHRNLAIAPGLAEPAPSPQEMVGRAARAGVGPDGRLRSWFDAAHAALRDHDVNHVRVDLGENPANALWFHGGGPGASPIPAAGPLGTGPRCVLAGRGALTTGLARLLGWTPLVVDGDDEALGAAAVAALEGADLLVVRTETPLHAAAVGGDAARDRALSAIDARLVAPLVGVLEERGDFLFGAACDLLFDAATKSVVRGDAPLVLLRSGDAGDADVRFRVADCRRNGFHPTPAAFASAFA